MAVHRGELFEGAFASKASDMFSIGATLYHLATGIHPDKAQSFDIWHVREGLPKDLRELILELTAADPRQRPTAEHLERAQIKVPAEFQKSTARSMQR